MVLALFLCGSAEAVNLQYRPWVNGRTPWYKQYARQPKIDHEIDYPVANYGQDHEIMASLKSTKDAEARLG